MIIDPTGEMPNVNGSRFEIVAIGPMPGSTPISVPMRQPRRQRPRLAVVNATEKPRARLVNMATKKRKPGSTMAGIGTLRMTVNSTMQKAIIPHAKMTSCSGLASFVAEPVMIIVTNPATAQPNLGVVKPKATTPRFQSPVVRPAGAVR